MALDYAKAKNTIVAFGSVGSSYAVAISTTEGHYIEVKNATDKDLVMRTKNLLGEYVEVRLVTEDFSSRMVALIHSGRHRDQTRRRRANSRLCFLAIYLRGELMSRSRCSMMRSVVMWQRSPILPFTAFGSDVNNVPVGMAVIDGGVVKICRYVGNFDNENITAAKDSVRTDHSTFDANSDFDLSITFMQRSTDTNVAFTGLLCQSLNASGNNRALWIERSGDLQTYLVSFYSGTVNAGHALTTTALVDDKFHKLRIVNQAKIASVYVDGALVGTINNVGWTVNQSQAINIGSQYLGSRCINGQIAKVSLQTSVGGFVYDFSESAGTSIIDRSGNGNNATLTDSTPATFWQKALVPVSVL